MARRDEQAVVIDGATKSFLIPSEHRNTLKERALHPVRRSNAHHLDALRDVTFDVKAGEFFGIVGRNGSGKSTLLKCLAGIYRLDGGRIDVAGRISPFIELGVGFHQELAARDNILLNGVMLGLTPRQAAERVERVIEFAELEDFTDLKLKNYSLGHERPAGLRGDDPGGRRRAPDRRDPRRRRRRLPAEVLRRLLPPARGGQDDRARDPRHGRRRALLPPRGAAREGRGGGARRAPRRGGPLPAS